MKKVLSLVLTAALTVSMLAGCTSKTATQESSTSAESTTAENTATDTKTEETAESTDTAATANTGETTKVAAMFFSLEGEFFKYFDDLLKENCTMLGYAYESQSSNGDALTMIQQIENAVAGGADLIFVWASSGAEVSDACAAAQKAGVKVLAFVQNPGEESVDVFRGSDETMCGEAIAALAKSWADDQYGADAGEGVISTVLFGNTDSAEQKERYEAMEASLKEDKRFNILESAGIEASTIKAQEATENMFSKYGQIDCILTTGGEMVLGVIAYAISEGSPVEDVTQMGIFGTEMNSELANYMKAGVLKGSVLNGGKTEDNVKEIAGIIDSLLKGEKVDNFSAVDMAQITADNLAEYGY
ncbi:sugar ABC transporter substrate-binding protein [Konateibacter massiliensis]|uniref:sugar ABC transporter substrate-binding protein n=1 Tax=Konateibacter massiliensis TaxID=2002841 RepID=UPI000C16192F|nr:sugar ABC transporter substrate-binding protein [Konateibacter massiliensis]